MSTGPDDGTRTVLELMYEENCRRRGAPVRFGVCNHCGTVRMLNQRDTCLRCLCEAARGASK